MNKSEAAAPHGSAHGHGDHAGHHTNYVKIYWILLALLAVSITGPMVGIQWLTLITAFGIALVKAYLVAVNFMHLNVEKRYVSYLLLTVVAFLLLFYAGVSPDVMHHRGRGWENVAAENWSKKAVQEAEALERSGGHHPGAEHGGQESHGGSH